jgi:hypothetical protein
LKVVLCGPAGVGKTRLARDALAGVESRWVGATASARGMAERPGGRAAIGLHPGDGRGAGYRNTRADSARGARLADRAESDTQRFGPPAHRPRGLTPIVRP